MNIKLCGVKGGRVEQLSSIAVRCAERLCVSFIDFFREMIMPLLYEGRERPKRGTLPSSCALEGALGAASEWIGVFNSLLGRTDLQRTTLLSWRETLAPRGLARSYRAWCPRCLREQLENEETVYEPLIWKLSEVTVCPHHEIRLTLKCPFCGQGRQCSLSAFARVGCCRHCGKWLGAADVQDDSMAVSDMEIFSARAISEMLEISNASGVPAILTSQAAIRALRDVFFEGVGSEMARALGSLPSQLNHYAAGSFPAPLHLFVRASYVTGASMEQIFVTNCFDRLQLDRSRSFELRRATPIAIYDASEARRRLEHSLAESGKESVHEIAVSMGIAPIRLWRREKELAAEVSRAHAEYVARSAAQERASYCDRVNAFVRSCKDRGIRPTTNELKSALDGNAAFLNSWKRSVIEEAMARVFGQKAVSAIFYSLPLDVDKRS